MALIMNNAGLFEEWKRDIRTMAGRIIAMRKELHRLLTEELRTPGNWDHIVNQIGMFRCVPVVVRADVVPPWCCGASVLSMPVLPCKVGRAGSWVADARTLR